MHPLAMVLIPLLATKGFLHQLPNIRPKEFCLCGAWNRRYNLRPKPPKWETGDYGTFERVPIGETIDLPEEYGGMTQIGNNAHCDGMSEKEIIRAIEVLERFVQPERIKRLKGVLSKRSGNICTVFENPSNPNNVWAALRTIDSFGIQNVHVIADPELYVKKGRLLTMSAAMGSQKWLTLHGHDSAEECARALKSRGYRILGSSLSVNSKKLDDIDWSAGPTAVAFGNELTGLSESMLSFCDSTFYIPMRGFAESFNVSVALSIVLTAAMLANKENREDSLDIDNREGLRGGTLGDDEARQVYLRWLMNSMKGSYEVLLRENIKLPDSLRVKYNVSGIAGFNPVKT